MDSHTLNQQACSLRNRFPDAHLWAVLPAHLEAAALKKFLPICALPMAWRCTTPHTPRFCGVWTGAVPFCCCMAWPSRARWNCARALDCGTWCTTMHRSTGWPPTKASCPSTSGWHRAAPGNRTALPRLRSAYRLSALHQVESITLALHDASALEAFIATTADLAGEHVLCHHTSPDATPALPDGALPATFGQAWMCPLDDAAPPS